MGGGLRSIKIYTFLAKIQKKCVKIVNYDQKKLIFPLGPKTFSAALRAAIFYFLKTLLELQFNAILVLL